MESEGHETQQGEASGLLTFADIQVKILKMLNEMPEVPLTVSWPYVPIYFKVSYHVNLICLALHYNFPH